MANRRREVPLEDVRAAIQTHKAEPLESRDRTLLLLGRSGVGKSALLNHIVGGEVVTENGPQVKKSQRVNGIESHDAKMDDRTLRVIDIPGLYHPSRMRRGSRRSRESLERQCDILVKDIQEGFNRAGSVVHAVGIVISMEERLSTAAVREMLEAIELFAIRRSSIILFITHGNAIFDMSPRINIEMGQQEQLRLNRFREFIEQEYFPPIVLDLNRDLGERVVIVDKEDRDRDSFVNNLFGVINICVPIQNPIIESVESCMNERRQEEEKRKLEVEDARRKLEEMRSVGFHSLAITAEDEHKKLYNRFETLQKTLANLKHFLYYDNQQKSRRTTEAFVRNSRKLKFLDDKMNRKFLQVCHVDVKSKLGNYIRAVKELIETRENMKTKFLTVADRIDNSFIASTTVKIVGSATGIIGGVLGTIGGALTLGGITAPAGIPLIVLGAVLGVGGLMASAGGSIGSIVVDKRSQNKGEEWIKDSNSKHQQLINQYEELESMFKTMEDIFQQHRQIIIKSIFHSDEIVAADFEAKSELVQKIIASWSQANALAIGSQVAVAGVQTGAAVARGVVGGVEAGAEIGATVIRTAAVASSSILIGVSSLFLAADIALLAKAAFDSHEFNKSNGTKLSRSFRAVAEDIMLTTENLRPLAAIEHCS